MPQAQGQIGLFDPEYLESLMDLGALLYQVLSCLGKKLADFIQLMAQALPRNGLNSARTTGANPITKLCRFFDRILRNFVISLVAL